MKTTIGNMKELNNDEPDSINQIPIINNPPFSHIALLIACDLISFFMMGIGGMKRIPGGPFISITGNILPVIIAFMTLFITIDAYPHSGITKRIIMLILTGFAYLLAIAAILSVYDFWMDPYARGRLIGF